MNRIDAMDNLMNATRGGLKPLLDRQQILPREQLIEATRRAQQGDQRSMEMVIHSMTRLVWTISSTVYKKWSAMLPQQASFEDIYSAGLEGLMIAIKKFDPDSGNTLTTYANLWIQQKAQRHVFDLLGPLHIPEQRVRKGLCDGDPLLHMNMFDIEATYGGSKKTNARPLRDVIESTGDVDRSEEVLQHVYDHCGETTGRIARLFHEGYTTNDISRICRMTTQAVRKHAAKIRVLLEEG